MDSALMFAAYQAEQDKLRQQPEQENNLVDALGKAALAAGVATAGIVGGRRFFAGRGAAPTPVRNTSATTDLSNINVNNLRRASGRPPVNVTETVVPSRPAPRPVPQTTIERLGDVNEITRQARSERPQGIQFLDLSDEVRTSVDPWSGKETILTPFGSPTVPPVRTTETTTRGTRLLSPAAPDAADRLLNDPDLLRRVNKEYNVGQEAKELAIDNLLSSNRSEQAKQAARRRQVLTATGDDIISTLRSEANTAEAAAQSDFGPQTFLKQKGYIDTESMTEQHVAARPQHIEQVEDALSSGTHQMEGRTKHRLQQNEDLDLGQIEIMEEMADAQYRNFVNQADPSQMMGFEPDIHVEQVASRLPDGLPVDQAEGLNLNTGRRYATYDEIPPMAPYKSSMLNPVTESYRREINRLKAQPNTKYVFNPPPEETPRLTDTSAARFLEQERNVISRELQNKDLPVAPTRIENELAKRLGGSTASSYGPKYTARKQALELYAQTGDPQFLETIEKFGLKPVGFDLDSEDITSLASSKKIVNMPGIGEVSTASLRRPVITESTARQADEFIKRRTEEKLNNNPWLENIKSKVEEGKQQIYSERRQLAEQTGKALKLQLEQAKARGQGNTVRQLENQIEALRDIYRNPELGQHRERGEGGILQLNASLRGAQETTLQQIQELQKKYPTTLTNPSGEVNRLFGILDDEGEFIPESMEFRSERPMIDTAPKGGSGRGIAEYAAGSRNEYTMGNSGRPPLFQRVGQENDAMTKKYRLVESAKPQSNLRDYHLETGGTANSFENDRTDTVSRAYTTPGGSREVLLYPTTETLIPARSQRHQTIPGKYVTSLIGRNQNLQGPPLKKVLPIVIQNKGETGVGSTIDRYGIRRDLDPVDDITLRPSEPVYTEDELRQEALRLALYDPYGDAPISRPSRDREQMEKEAAQSLGSQPKTLAGRQSINASEEILRIQRNNPPAKAQALVSSFLQQLKGG